ncbi:TonB-dependent receptor domain-containing protein [Roseateles sp. LKC17W]|uniref:TonB-dependent receptor domain-containing protein n=1 Tax=Pelomonas margarita TaxID=3299031 RepID=A0ABW7FF62_9BURK
MKKPPKPGRPLMRCGAGALLALTPLGAALAQATEPGATQQIEKVVITGSRVISNGDSSPSPVTVMRADELLASKPGATLAEALNSLPVFAGSRGATSNPTTSGSAAGGNGAANQLNLRNIGATRTLVLMDGKRVPPTLYNGVVDVDLIPQMFVERVDVVTGGVSAVYGSDAMSGVVNYIINRQFNGVRAEASYGLSALGDAGRASAGIAWGGNVAPGLHLEAGFEAREQDGIDHRTSRDWLTQWGVTGAGTTANPYVLQNNVRQKDFPFGGLITSGALAGQVFKTNGQLSPFVAGTSTGTTSLQLGGDGGYWDASLMSALSGRQFFGRADYQVSDSVRAHAQISGNLKTNTNWAETPQLAAVSLRRSNAFLPDAVRALMPAGESTFRFSKFMSDIPRANAVADAEQWVAMAGVEGKGAGLSWSVDVVHGRARLETALNNVINRQSLAAALDAVSSNGQVVCNIRVSNPGLADDCVPLNVFGPSAASAAAIDYVTDTVRFGSTTTMNDVSAQVSGSLFSTWAGPVTAALSGEWRELSFSSTSSSRPGDLVSCTGLTLNCTAGTVRNEYVFGETPQGVSQRVWEVAGELDVPLLKDAAFAKQLNLNAALRDTHYDTSGNYKTWKLGLDWHVLDALRFRVTRSRDIRAPTLYDLYAPTSIVQVRPTDLLTGLTPTVPQYDQSNPRLTAEIGNTTTVGLVWKPAPRLSLAVDAYRIRISDAVTQVAGSTTTFQQLCYASGGASTYCAMQTRPNGYTDTSAANAVTAWTTSYINIAEIETWGVDLEANVAGTLLNRPASLRVLTAWQPHVYYRQPGLATVDQGGVAFGALGLASTPSVRVSAFFRFKPTDAVSLELGQRWRSAMKLGGDPTQVWVNNHMASFATTSLNVAYDFGLSLGRHEGDAQVYLNVDNLFNRTPPPGAFSGNGTRAGLRDGFSPADDPRGRYFTVGARLLF